MFSRKRNDLISQTLLLGGLVQVQGSPVRLRAGPSGLWEHRLVWEPPRPYQC